MESNHEFILDALKNKKRVLVVRDGFMEGIYLDTATVTGTKYYRNYKDEIVVEVYLETVEEEDESVGSNYAVLGDNVFEYSIEGLRKARASTDRIMGSKISKMLKPITKSYEEIQEEIVENIMIEKE